MTRLIQAHPALADIPLVPIDGVSEEEAQRLIRESLFFLAFSEKEGFGLPPAEAMATGSLVIGYTGVGGAEYFTSETGFPIADGDAIAFLETLVEVVQLWRSAPASLEAKREAASAFMWRAHSEAQAVERLTTLWAEIDAGLLQG
nr:glycosyltransferase [Stagnihabitans tardus]